MKKFKYILVAAMAAVTLFSCKKDDDKPAPVPVPTPEAPKTVAEAKTDDKEKTYTVRLQNTTGTFVMGYNDLMLSVVDAAGKEVDLEAATFTPWMNMFKGDGKGGFIKEVDFTHSCPHTPLAKEGNVWKSQALFQMKTGPSGVWFATITFKVAGKEYELKRLDFEVKPQPNKALGTVNRFKLFSGDKGQVHLYALVAPESPKAGENEIALGIWKMQNMQNFPQVTDWVVEVKVSEKGSTTAISTATLRYERGFYRGKVTYPKAGEYTLSYTLKDAQGKAIQPQDNDKKDISIATTIQF
ncbi:FixH family protein [Capnocytophaga gingivalis]|uniref:FixH family protein n=1 Tax=Capnocytophaga gingivalis TaxID=1017 RepID=A0ABU5Z8F2_9FLAO|nr:FixH family protein [Capnocytophaga gingivalis]MEB3074407.1 FixH family protein [Capnocytophaga gingivalis]